MAAGDKIADPGWSGAQQIWPEDVEATKVIHGDNLGRGFEYVPQQDQYQYLPVNELWG